jgi:hypothetical protein
MRKTQINNQKTIEIQTLPEFCDANHTRGMCVNLTIPRACSGAQSTSKSRAKKYMLVESTEMLEEHGDKQKKAAMLASLRRKPSACGWMMLVRRGFVCPHPVQRTSELYSCESQRCARAVCCTVLRGGTDMHAETDPHGKHTLGMPIVHRRHGALESMRVRSCPRCPLSASRQKEGRK